MKIFHISYCTAGNTLTRHETLSKSFSIFKISAIVTPMFGIIIISVVIFLCCRTKNIGQIVSLLSISKATNAFPMNESSDEKDYEFDAFTSVSIIIFLFLWGVYLIIQYYKFDRRVFNHLALTFTECISDKNPPKWKLILSLSNCNIYCYLHITEVLTYPDLIVTNSGRGYEFIFNI